jgi:large subunit ribosomal protein L18
MPHQVKHSPAKTRRIRRVRSHVRGTADQPRLSVFRSHQHIYAQIIDDHQAVTLASANSLQFKKPQGSKRQQAQLVGQQIAKLALKKNLKRVKFDRGPYCYHGRVKALAQAARDAGLEF